MIGFYKTKSGLDAHILAIVPYNKCKPFYGFYRINTGEWIEARWSDKGQFSYSPSDYDLVGFKRKATSTDRKRVAIGARDGWNCHYCGIELNIETATIDHFIPKSKCGSNELRNLVLSCKSCNQEKGSNIWQKNHKLHLNNEAK